MDNKEQFSVTIDCMPDLLRGLGYLMCMSQNAAISMPDESLFVIDTFCQYLADDMEKQYSEILKREHINYLKNKEVKFNAEAHSA